MQNLQNRSLQKDLKQTVLSIPQTCWPVSYTHLSVPYADKVITEITCHGKGAWKLFGKDGVVIDIGGQDTKGIVLKSGRVMKFVMNDKCSAGTGKFLEVMTNRLGLTQKELSELASQGKDVTISSMCTGFAESEAVSYTHLQVIHPGYDVKIGKIDLVPF